VKNCSQFLGPKLVTQLTDYQHLEITFSL